MNPITRRRFLTGTMATAFSLGAWRRADGANDSIRMAVVGLNWRGSEHLGTYKNQGGGYLALPNVRVVALCDVDSEILGKQAAILQDKHDLKVDTYADIRKLLENKDIDAVSIATPNHQHALQAIWAMQAGKDVYCEKPISHNLWEGRKLVECAASTRKICAAGTQCRSNPAIIDAVKYVQEGNLGKIQSVRGLCYKRRDSIGKVDGAQPIPKSVDYDLWCGPARMLPLMRKKLHYDWHWIWETGNGDLGNQGAHQMDIARWILGENRLSPAVFSVGGRFGYDDDGQTPNTLLVYHDYKPAPLIFEVRGLPEKVDSQEMNEFMGAQIGVVVKCAGGNLIIPQYDSAYAEDGDGTKIMEFKGAGDPFKNFIDAILSRKQSTLNAPIEEGHISSGLCHMGNISYRLGAATAQDKIRDKLRNNPDALETFESINMHLQTNRVDLGKTKAILGEFLTFDPVSESFSGSSDANKLLKRDYRAPYTIPNKV